MANRLMIEQKMDEMIVCMQKANEIAEFGAIETKFDGTVKTYNKLMREWFALHAGSPKTLTTLCNEWYDETRTGWYGWTKFDQPTVSTGSTGTKGGDNTSLTCTPSTDTVANVDDYAGLPLFAVTTVNWELDENGKKVITAIKGISSTFESNNPDKYVGVMQMAGYVKVVEDDTSYTMYYGDSTDNDLKPLPEAIEPDGTINNFVLHSKYMSHTTDGKMTSCSGVIPTCNISYNGLVPLAHQNGSYYSGGSITDWSFLVWMTMIKYGSMTLDGIIQGCCQYDIRYTVAVAETGVTRVILTQAQAANVLVGSQLIVGTNASTDRGAATSYSISGRDGFTVSAIEAVTIDDTAYSAVYFDTDSTFDTAADTQVQSWHWKTGSCDGVLGNDGSPISATSGKSPSMLQGIEFAVGGYEVFGDTILHEDGEQYLPYVCADASKLIANATTSTDGYADTGLRSAQPESAAWMYIDKLHYKNGVFFGTTENSGSSAKYCKDAFYKDKLGTTGYREWLAFGTLVTGASNAGLSCLHGTASLGYGYWDCLARLSCNGNRGELAA